MKRNITDKWMTSVMLFVLLCAVSGVQAADPDPVSGKVLSAKCSRCHGKHGIAENPQLPNLAGQNMDYLIIQLQHFRSGFRRSTVMRQIAKGLSDEDIVNLAAYYNQLQ